MTETATARPLAAERWAGHARAALATYLPIGTALFVAAYVVYQRVFSTYLVNDDLSTWHQVNSLSPLQFVMNTYADKFRPVSNAMLYGEVKVFGTDYQLYNSFNILLLVGVACVCFYTVTLLTSRRLFGLIAALLTIGARFSWYDIAQIQGSMESLSLLFAALTFAFIARHFRDNRLRDFVAAVIFFGAATFSHERYIVLVIPLVWVAVAGQGRTWRTRLALSGIAVIPAVLNYAIKVFVLHLHFFQGTGGTAISSSLELELAFARNILFNSIGIPWGPNYLSAINIQSSEQALQVVELISAAAIVLLGVLWIVDTIIAAVRRRSVWRRLLIMGTWVSAYVGLVASSSVTIRVEMRWVYGPYLLVIIVAATAVADLCSGESSRFRRVASIVAQSIGSIFAAALFVVNAYALRFTDNSFFVGWEIEAKIRYDETVGTYGTALLTHPLVFVDGATPQDWVGFFDPYEPLGLHAAVTEVATLDLVPPSALAGVNGTVVFVQNPLSGRFEVLPSTAATSAVG